jgi:hypothetical protein
MRDPLHDEVGSGCHRGQGEGDAEADGRREKARQRQGEDKEEAGDGPGAQPAGTEHPVSSLDDRAAHRFPQFSLLRHADLYSWGRATGMFNRFTDRSRMVLDFARAAALEFRHDYIGTEHILLGLLREGSGVAADVMQEQGIDPATIRKRIEKLLAHGKEPLTLSQLPFTARAKRVLELGLEEAQGLGYNYLGTEHLLLGLIRVPEAPAGQVLGELGLESDTVREQVRKMVGEGRLDDARGHTWSSS